MSDDEQRLTGEELRKSYWLITHVRDIRKRIALLCIIIITCFWIFAIISFISIYVLSYQQNRAHRQNIVSQSSAFTRPVQLADPSIIARGAVSASGEMIDLYALVSNPHEAWWGEFDYHFELDGKALSTRRDFLLPQSKHYVLQLGEQGSSGSSMQFILERVRWHFVSTYRKKVLFQRNRFAAQNISYVPSSQTEFARALPISSLRFDFVNNTPYSYWEAIVPIVAKAGDTIIAASLVRLADINRGETRPVEVRWFHSFEFPTSFEITPHLNVLDPSAYRTQ